VTTTAEINEFTGTLAQLVTIVQSGHEVLLTQDHKPVARLVAASEKEIAPRAPLHFLSLKGHRTLTPVISQVELAEEMFGPK
jgi:antitoxin (DNA-binding transcriptional repressor) of toxin-antitoxin stability system